MEEQYQEFEAKTVDEAIVAAMKTFRAKFENLEIQVISEGSKGLFGLVGAKAAKILARPASRLEAPVSQTPGEFVPAPEPDEEPSPATPEDPALVEEAKGIITEILGRMNIPCQLRVHEDSTIEIVGDGSGLIIGKRGQTLDSLQFIVNRILNKDRQEPRYITLDTEGYRQRHMSHLKSLAIKMSQKARRTGQSVSLERMNPYDRRIIHLALKNDSRVNTMSIGDGIYKKVVIVPRKASK